MRLNPDCIRNIILYVESTTTPNEDAESPYLFENIPEFDEETIYYHVKYLDDAGMFTKVHFYMGGEYAFSINDLSPLGHDFAQNIHNDTNWNKIKDSASKVGSFSLDTLQKIAINVIASALSTQFIK